MSSEGIKKILNMVKEGKITPEEGERLILALGYDEKQTKDGKYLRISMGDESNTMNFKIPLSLIKFILHVIPDEVVRIHLDGRKIEVPLKEMIKELQNGDSGFIEEKSDSGFRIKLWIE